MKFYCGLLLTAAVLASALAPAVSFKADDVEYAFRERDPDRHEVAARSIRVFSRGPDPDAPAYVGPDLHRHLKNAASGGSVGLELDLERHAKKLSKLWQKLKGLFPQSQKFQKRRGDARSRSREENEMEDRDLVGEGTINPRLREHLRKLKELSERMKNL